jgi:hypothetical protein
MLNIIPFYSVLYAINKLLIYITHDNIIPSYSINILVNITYISVLLINNFEPSYLVADLMMSLITASYILDTQKLLTKDFPLQDKLTYIPHHIVSIALIMGQANNLYPLRIGMWYLSLFEFSNFFLQFFQLFNKKNWRIARNIMTYPFVITYVPIRCVIIPLYSLNFIPYICAMSIINMLMFSFLFTFVNTFSLYFSWVVGTKFIEHYKKKNKNKQTVKPIKVKFV